MTTSDAMNLFIAISTMLGGGKAPYLFTPQTHSVKLSHNFDVTDKYEQIVCYLLPHRSGKAAWLANTTAEQRKAFDWLVWKNLCVSSTQGCRAACLHMAGRLGMAGTAKLARTALLAASSHESGPFWTVVDAEITRHKARVARNGKELVVRLNGTSDIDVPSWIIEKHDEVIFFTYTKRSDIPLGWMMSHPNVYNVFSASENTSDELIHEILSEDVNVVVPFDVKRGDDLPTEYLGHRVIDGDKHDLRFLDDDGVIVGLRYKPVPGSPNHHGFIRPVPVSIR
jgi:hypothetical protein